MESHTMKKIFLPIALGTAMLTLAAPTWAAWSHGPFRHLVFRNIGPAVAGGRVTSVVGVPGNRNLYVVGTAGGGVWKTTNGGDSWKNVFDHEATMSIGAVTLDPGHPDWVWVGTGEANPRNDMLNGAGVYFS
ncbi:conserved hypothetical protein, secreted, partial [mine drainage metagenome]